MGVVPVRHGAKSGPLPGTVIMGSALLEHGKTDPKRLRVPCFLDPEGLSVTIADKAS
jgi:hypothetical protein